MDGFSCSAPHHSVFHAGLSVLSCLQHYRYTFSIVCAVQPVEPRQGDASVGVDVAVGPLVHPLDQVLLVQQRVVGAERAGRVVKSLVVMAELRLPARRQELVDMHHLTQWHHHDRAYTRIEETTLKSRVNQNQLHFFTGLFHISALRLISISSKIFLKRTLLCLMAFLYLDSTGETLPSSAG